MPVNVINDQNFEKLIKEAGKPVLVDFYAVWCGPCKMAAPILDQLAQEYEDKVSFFKLNIDENQTIPEQYGVMSVPTVMLFSYEDNAIKILSSQVGFAGEAGYRSLLDAVVE